MTDLDAPTKPSRLAFWNLLYMVLLQVVAAAAFAENPAALCALIVASIGIAFYVADVLKRRDETKEQQAKQRERTRGDNMLRTAKQGYDAKLQKLVTEHDEKLEKLKTEHDEKLEKLKDEHEKQLKKLKDDLQSEKDSHVTTKRRHAARISTLQEQLREANREKDEIEKLVVTTGERNEELESLLAILTTQQPDGVAETIKKLTVDLEEERRNHIKTKKILDLTRRRLSEHEATSTPEAAQTSSLLEQQPPSAPPVADQGVAENETTVPRSRADQQREAESRLRQQQEAYNARYRQRTNHSSGS